MDNADLEERSCWEWKGARDGDGYGLKTVNGRQWRVHRLSYMEASGEDPGELQVLHSCDNPPCYRPSHLRPGTNADNVADKVARGRSRNQHTDAESCVYGHAFSDENTYINPSSGNRQCRTCRRLSNALDRKLGKAPKETRKVLREVFRERLRQDFVFGEQNHPDGTSSDFAGMRDFARARCQAAAANGTVTWRHILNEEFLEALAETDPEALRAELVQLAACAVAQIECIDRRAGRKEATPVSPLASFSVVTNSGYPELQHFPDEDTDDGCLLMFVDATRLDEMVEAARAHKCGGTEE